MTPLHWLLFVALLVPAPGLRAQDSKKPDKDLLVLEARLQEHRAAALSARLALYTDELKTLRAKYNADSNGEAVAAVDQEVKTVREEKRILDAIAKGEQDPPAPGEVKEGAPPDATALAKKRINTILARFEKERGHAPLPAGPSVAAQPRQHILRIKDATRNKAYADSEGAAYWAYSSSYAVWSVYDIAPGDYDVILRYTAGKDSGGTATIKAAGKVFTVEVQPGDRKDKNLPAGTLSVRDSGLDIRVENAGLAKDAKHLWNLEGVQLQPVTKRP